MKTYFTGSIYRGVILAQCVRIRLMCQLVIVWCTNDLKPVRAKWWEDALNNVIIYRSAYAAAEQISTQLHLLLPRLVVHSFYEGFDMEDE
tara:strand:+ start:91 stop:360 length:270 start_codon:yes stop_codon:yes gene_type:complete